MFLILVDYRVTTPHPSLKSLGKPLQRGAESHWGVVMTLHSPYTDPSLKSLKRQTRNAKEANGQLLLAHRQSASCSSLFRREQLQRHTLTVVRELWFRKERTASPSGSDWQFVLMRLPAKSRAQTIRADEPIAISEGWGKGEWGARSTHHPSLSPFYKGASMDFSEGWGVNQGNVLQKRSSVNLPNSL